MTNHPAFRPVAYGGVQHGTFPADVSKSQSGQTAITRFGDKEIGRRVSLTFHLTYAQWLEWRDHKEEKGSVFSFLFDPVTLPANLTPTGYRWRYVDAASVEDLKTNFFIVSCTYEAAFHVSTYLISGSAWIITSTVETAVSLVPSSPPPAPTLTVVGLADGLTTNGWVQVAGLSNAAWEWSIDGGATWQPGAGESFRVPAGTYAAGAVRVRAINAAGASTAAQAPAVQVLPPTSAVITFSCNAGATADGTVALPLTFGEILRVQFSQAGWFRLYGSVADRSADAPRLRTAIRPTASGVALDVIAQAATAFNLSPVEDIRSTENPQTTVYPWRFVNDGASGTITIILTYYKKI